MVALSLIDLDLSRPFPFRKDLGLNISRSFRLNRLQYRGNCLLRQEIAAARIRVNHTLILQSPGFNPPQGLPFEPHAPDQQG